MQATETSIPGVIVLSPRVFSDGRGFFFESYNQKVFEELIGETHLFVQDNHSKSEKGVLRGLHYQVSQIQGKLVRCTVGEIFDVAVDLRGGSETFGKWTGSIVSADNKRQLWIPPGFAHGFLTISEIAEVNYKTTDYYAPNHERCIRWDDPNIGIEWPLEGEPLMSEKDRLGLAFEQAELPVVGG